MSATSGPIDQQRAIVACDYWISPTNFAVCVGTSEDGTILFHYSLTIFSSSRPPSLRESSASVDSLQLRAQSNTSHSHSLELQLISIRLCPWKPKWFKSSFNCFLMLSVYIFTLQCFAKKIHIWSAILTIFAQRKKVCERQPDQVPNQQNHAEHAVHNPGSRCCYSTRPW